MKVVLHAFPDEEPAALRLATALGLRLGLVQTHRFPDGEILPRVQPPADTILVYRSLDRPNEKIIELMLAVDAWRRSGARRIVLVAPYLCYMRQDAAFSRGEPISQQAICTQLDTLFDRVVTVDPHLHRTASLSDLFRHAECTCVPSADVLIPHLRKTQATEDMAIVGPDGESRQWVARLAGALGSSYAVLQKQRFGDEDVALSNESVLQVAGRNVLLVDDICSTGVTLAAAVRAVKAAGAASAKVWVTHAMCSADALDTIIAAGAECMLSSDSCAHSTNTVMLAPVLAAVLRRELTAV